MISGIGLITGLDYLVGHAHGAGQDEKGFRYFAQSLYVSVALSVGLTVLMFGLSYRLSWLAINPEVLPSAETYLHNFPPAKLPNGEWGMICRAPDYQRNVFLLSGGIERPNAWTRLPVVTEAPADGFRPEEPDWWTLPDGRLLGLFRDNARSRRFYRAVSSDSGRTWTAPEKTNFPDATSKFFCLRTSRGFYALVSNANPKDRNPLCLSTSDDGVTFTRMARLPVPVKPEGGAFDAAHTSGSVQYPHVIENDGHLFICYSRKKTAIEVIKVSLDEVERLRRGQL
jgi:hypothetical protein